MSKGRDLFEQWRDQGVPYDASIGDAEAVMREFFTRVDDGEGSHVFLAKHLWLAGIPRLGRGFVTVHLRKGRVPKECLKDLLFAARCMDWLRQQHYAEDKPVPPSLGEGLEKEFG